jgi:hypothetical protein
MPLHINCPFDGVGPMYMRCKCHVLWCYAEEVYLGGGDSSHLIGALQRCANLGRTDGREGKLEMVRSSRL